MESSCEECDSMACVAYCFVPGDSCDDQCLASTPVELAFWKLQGGPGSGSVRSQLIGSKVLVDRRISGIYVDSVAHRLGSSPEEE